eukprot:jgi/Bigna1/89888/estExt_fgenesh1_pg.C_570070
MEKGTGGRGESKLTTAKEENNTFAASLLGGNKIVDCTQTITEDAFSFGGRFGLYKSCPFKMEEKKGFKLGPDELVAKGAIIDVTEKDVVDWEKQYGQIPKRAIVIMKTGWGARFNDIDRYENKDKDGVCNFPGFHPDTAKLLIQKREIVGIGIDTPSLDYGPSKNYPTHKIILGADKYQIENMNLEGVEEGASTTFISSPMLVKGAPESETRVFAVVGTAGNKS